jgi:hypothetical protein
LALAGGLLRAAVVIGKHEDPIARRSAVSRAYYGVYQAARATVFGVHGRDEGDHDRVAQLVDDIVHGQGSVQTALKELRDLRNEMDYSPYLELVRIRSTMRNPSKGLLAIAQKRRRIWSLCS